MPTVSMLKKRRLLYSPEKSFHLPVYAEKMALSFAEFGGSIPKPHKPSYARNVLEFIDGSASEGRETSDSSTDKDSTTESTAT